MEQTIYEKKVKYYGIADLQFEMTTNIYRVFERRRELAKYIIKQNPTESKMEQCEQEIEYLNNIIKRFLILD